MEEEMESLIDSLRSMSRITRVTVLSDENRVEAVVNVEELEDGGRNYLNTKYGSLCPNRWRYHGLRNESDTVAFEEAF